MDQINRPGSSCLLQFKMVGFDGDGNYGLRMVVKDDSWIKDGGC